jgi:hypothetical protein
MPAKVRSLFIALTGLAFSTLFGLSVSVAAVSDQEMAAPKSEAAQPQADATFDITVPTIETDGSNVDEAVLRSVFEGKLADHAAELSKLTARRIRIPEVRVRVVTAGEGEGRSAETVYKDIVLTNIVDGVAESTLIGGVDFDGDKDVRVHFGKISTGMLDLAGLLQFYGYTPGAPSTEMKPLYRDVLMEGGALSSPEVNCKIGEIKLAEVKARPIKVPFGEIMTVARELSEKKQDVSPDLVAKFVSFYADLFSAFQSTPTYSSGFDCNGDSPKGPVAVGVKSITVGGFSPGHYPEVSVSGISVQAPEDSSVSIGNFRFKGFDYSGSLKTLEAANGHFDEEWVAQHYRELIPAFEGWAVADVKVDVPNEESGERIQSSIAAVDISLAAYVNGVPTDISSSASHIAFAVPADSGIQWFDQLKGFGIDNVDLSYEFAAKWDEAASDIRVDKLSVNGVDMGSIGLSGIFGNANRDLFSTDDETSARAAFGVTVKQFAIDLKDAGLENKFIAAMAAMADQDVEKFRSLTSGKVRGSILSLLGSTPQVDALSGAIGTFIDLGGSLSIKLKSKDAAGIDFDTVQSLLANPAAITDLVDIGASATPPPQ